MSQNTQPPTSNPISKQDLFNLHPIRHHEIIEHVTPYERHHTKEITILNSGSSNLVDVLLPSSEFLHGLKVLDGDDSLLSFYSSEEIQKNGAIISENFVETRRYDKYKFLERNAVISGISGILIAVESSTSGGTSWQVDLAIKQGKTVIAIEPEKDNTVAQQGFKQFRSKGALTATKPSDVYEIVKEKSPFKEHRLTEYDFETTMKDFKPSKLRH